MDEAAPQGRIVTFYSYKGGTGRSMAMANVSWLLALSGYKVLAIDWDLEAPGLHRYFRPFLEDAELAESNGVIDFVIDFVKAASEQTEDETDPDWYKPYSNLLQYARELDYDFPGEGRLDLIPAGRQDEGYAVRVNSFNWKHFWEKLNGGKVLQEACAMFREEYDFVLIDSRTGVSDTAGICTLEMPDELVVGFTLNLQSVIGASKTAASILGQRSMRNRPIRIFPVAMRVEPNEFLKTGTMKDYAKPRFLPLLPPEMGDEEREKYWGETDVPYIPFYAFEENLAYFRDEFASKKTVLAAMTLLAARLARREIADLPKLDKDLKLSTIAKYDAFSGSRAAAAEAPSARPAIYVAARTESGAADLRAEIERAGFELLTRARFESAKAAVFLTVIDEAGLTAQQSVDLTIAERRRIGPIFTVLLTGAQPDDLPRMLLPYGVIDLRKGGAFALPDAASEAALPHLPLAPYPGLNPFTTTDGPVFIARGAITTRLFEAVTRSNLVSLIGPRHSGRTSLVYAGLIPRLKAAEQASSPWEVRTSWPSSPAPAGRTLVVMDVLAAAAAATTEIPANMCVLAIAETAEQVSYCEQKLKTAAERLEVPQLSDAELISAIVEPATRAGLNIDEGLAERIVADLKNERAKLPLLQFVMAELYANTPRGALTTKKYERMGGLGVVERKCEAALAGADLSAIGRLVFLADDGALLPQEISEASLRQEDYAVFDSFVGAGILVRQGTAIRFADRIFLDRWPRLRQWVIDNRDFLVWRQALGADMAAWQANQKAWRLLQGEKLQEATRWAAQRPVDLNAIEHAYIEASTQKSKEDTQSLSANKKQERQSVKWIVTFATVVILGGGYTARNLLTTAQPGTVAVQQAPVKTPDLNVKQPAPVSDVGFPARGWCYQEAATPATRRLGLTDGYGAYCHPTERECASTAARSRSASACVFVEKLDLKAWGGVQPDAGGYPNGRSVFRLNMPQKLQPPFPEPPVLQNQKVKE